MVMITMIDGTCHRKTPHQRLTSQGCLVMIAIICVIRMQRCLLSNLKCECFAGADAVDVDGFVGYDLLPLMLPALMMSQHALRTQHRLPSNVGDNREGGDGGDALTAIAAAPLRSVVACRHRPSRGDYRRSIACVPGRCLASQLKCKLFTKRVVMMRRL